MTRLLLVLFLLAITGTAVVAYKDPERVARYSDTISDILRRRAELPSRAVNIPRGQSGEFAVQARINGTAAAMHGRPASRIRCGSSAITARRSAPSMRCQRAISGRVRPQPKQRLVLGSIIQTAMHGVSWLIHLVW